MRRALRQGFVFSPPRPVRAPKPCKASQTVAAPPEKAPAGAAAAASALASHGACGRRDAELLWLTRSTAHFDAARPIVYGRAQLPVDLSHLVAPPLTCRIPACSYPACSCLMSATTPLTAHFANARRRYDVLLWRRLGRGANNGIAATVESVRR